MLALSKHEHPDKTLISIACLMLNRIKQIRIDSYYNLLQHIKKIQPDCDILFLSALHFLFLFGIIKYYPQTDRIEFIDLKISEKN